jgi:PAS domain S-box-containing protein
MDLNPQVLWEDGGRVFCRGSRLYAEGLPNTVLAVFLEAEHPQPTALDRLAHEYELRDELESDWAVRPLALVREDDRTILILDDPGGEPLGSLLGAPMELRHFLDLAVCIAGALSRLHKRGLVHKDVKPSHIMVGCTDGQVRLTGFGLASRLARQRQAPEPPETIAGTLAYMAPEQTGRMNRSIDTRSDLYALGVTLYQMLTGVLPFTASDPMDWVHCHIARQAMAPSQRLENIPAQVSQIVMKLLAKTAEDRYQSATGVERDLQRCLTSCECQSRIDDFPLGQYDTPDRLLIPEKLYGREREVETLLAAFDRIVRSGAPELVLVCGYSGIGKSSVVNELHKVLVPPRGLFASGKFDQYKRDIPYSTLVQAFQSLVRPLLSESDTELVSWRSAFLEALEPNARLMTDLIPELKFIIGEQPPIPELEPQQAQSRFQLVFRRFIGVFARPEHPLALFLDDLQWLDGATLDLLEDLLARSDLQHLMLIGAYRDNEVDASHPLTRKRDAIRQAGARMQEIRLAPLTRDDLEQLIADALRSDPSRVAPLAQLVHEKTAGNPFFVIQFLNTLAEQGLLRFDHDAACWAWNLDRIHSEGYTDNVVDLMVGKVIRLPDETQQALQQFACLGNLATIGILSTVLAIPEEQAHAVLWPGVRQELVERLDDSYRFIHDRVQEAAYSFIPQASRAAAHLRIGRLMLTHTPPEQQEEAIFEIVGQLNRGVTLITEQEELEQLAEYNLIAGKRAMASTAYVSALIYLNSGVQLLNDACWDRRHELIFALELSRAECEFLTGLSTVADKRLDTLSERARTTVERAMVACLHMDVCTTLDRSDRAVGVCLDYLGHVGIAWSPHPTDEDVRCEYERILSLLGGRTIEELIDLPLMEDAASLATVDVLTKLLPAAAFTDANLNALTSCKAVSLSLERGNCDASCVSYVMLSRVAGPRFGHYKTGFQFSQLGYDLVQRRGLKHFAASTCVCFAGFAMCWTKNVRACRDLLFPAFEAANKIGDLTYATYARWVINTDNLVAGDPLAEVQREAEIGLAFAEKARFGLVINWITTQIALIRTLRGLTPKFGCFDNDDYNELRVEAHLTSTPGLAMAACLYWIQKMQARYLAEDYGTAMDVASKAEQLLWTTPMILEESEYHFYAALTKAACCAALQGAERQQQIDAVAAHHKHLKVWAQNCPENFGHRAALVEAELAHMEGRDLEAMRLYRLAARSARDHRFVHIEALAYELTARFYAAHEVEDVAHLYWSKARYCYLRWGADGKVRQLDELYPQLKEGEQAPGPTGTITTPVEHLDLATVIKVSQAVSGGMVLERLIDTLMRTAIAQAGAQRGLLMQMHCDEMRIAAEAATSGDTVCVELRDTSVTAAALPEAVLHYVLRTREPVILDDAAIQPAFAADPYIRQYQAHSLLCLPLINQAKLIGVLYLENNLTPRAFAPTRIAVLKLLASQAAVSLENARLYRDVAEQEARIRRLVDANIIGIIIFTLDGQIIEANEAFLALVGYSREDLLSGRMSYTGMTPPEWQAVTRLAMEQLEETGVCKPYEKEYERKDGTHVPVLVGPALFEGSKQQGVAFVLDLTERKRTEAEARENERRYREVEIALAHANRLATMGQLTASIAHEVSQPIAAARNNAASGLRFLSRDPPDLEEVREALDSVVSDTDRAARVIDRIRAHVRKVPPRVACFNINDAIAEVIKLARGEVAKNGVAVRMSLADGLPLVQGDRVELQQIVLNLVLNAVEAMGAVDSVPRELSISTQGREGDEILVAVGDTGPGIDPKERERVFESLYTTKPTGMGLGLSICRSIVNARGGRLWAEANQPRGALFQFTLPARDRSS